MDREVLGHSLVHSFVRSNHSITRLLYSVHTAHFALLALHCLLCTARFALARSRAHGKVDDYMSQNQAVLNHSAPTPSAVGSHPLPPDGCGLPVATLIRASTRRESRRVLSGNFAAFFFLLWRSWARKQKQKTNNEESRTIIGRGSKGGGGIKISGKGGKWWK